MTFLRSAKTLVLTTLWGLVGCSVSIESTQLSFLKTLLDKGEAQAPAEKTWTLLWQGRAYPVYAINLERGTIFASEDGHLVNFDGWQVYEFVTANERGKERWEIEAAFAGDGQVILSYHNSRRLARFRSACEPWKKSGLVYRQECSSITASKEKYTNEIRLNPAKELIFLRFLVRPGDNAVVELSQTLS